MSVPVGFIHHSQKAADISVGYVLQRGLQLVFLSLRVRVSLRTTSRKFDRENQNSDRNVCADESQCDSRCDELRGVNGRLL